VKSAKFYVYVIFRPNGEPCYVGKGQGKRCLEHFTARGSHNPYLARIVKKHGGSLPLVKVQEGLAEIAAHEVEVALISAIGRWENGGPLANMTDGGEGISGLKHSAEARAKMSAYHRANPPSAETQAKSGLARRGRVVSPETGARISRANTGKTGSRHTEESKEKIAAAKRGVPRPAHVVEALRQANLGKKRGPTSEATKAKLRAVNSRGPRSEEEKSRIAEATRRAMEDPEVRRRVSEGRRAAHERKRLSKMG